MCCVAKHGMSRLLDGGVGLGVVGYYGNVEVLFANREVGQMELAQEQKTILDEYLDYYRPLIGDKRTEELVRGTVEGIIGAESLVCARIAAHSPILATKSQNGEQRVRRMAAGETTKRSELDSEHLVDRLQSYGVRQLGDEGGEVLAIMDMSELRKPYSRQMSDLMKVRALGGEGLVPGYRTINVLGIGSEHRRGVLYHRLFSSEADDFESESKEIRAAIDSVGAALAGRVGRVTYVTDSQFDDEAVWGAIWEQGNHLVGRLKHKERLVEQVVVAEEVGDQEQWRQVTIEEAAKQARELARVRTDLVVRKTGQKREKLQPVTAVILACRIRVTYQVDVRTRKDGAIRQKVVWLVVVRLEHVNWEPWLLLTDWSVEDAPSAVRVFQAYRQRWAVEDCFKFTKQVLGWEDVQLLDLTAVRTLVALGWVAAGFLYELGITLEWPEVRLLARLGGWTPRQDRKPGKTIITRGLQRLLDHWSTDAILRDEIARHGQLPPRIAAFLNTARTHAG